MLKKYALFLILPFLLTVIGPQTVYANVGLISTSSGYRCTALGGFGTGATNGTSGRSYWYYYDGGYGSYEKINWKLNCSNSSTDYDMFLYNCGSSYPGTLVASATSSLYPDSLVYQCSSTARYLLLEVRYFSGPTTSEFYLSGVRRPTTKNTRFWLNGRNQTLYGYPNTTTPQDGIEGYNGNASTEREHWYETIAPAWLANNDSTFRYKIKSTLGDYDLFVYDENNVLVASATSSTNPEYTGWIRYKSLPSQSLYLRVYAYNGINSEYRVDDGGSSITGVEGNPEDMALPAASLLHDIYPNPSHGDISIKYALFKQGDVNLKIYNIAGEMVYSHQIKGQSSGIHYYQWNCRNSLGHKISQGVYFVELNSSSINQRKRFVVIK
ncbi:MAG: T9SS type A sorting domain-containing protein [Candidatus Edwardsbacteria bacterium]|nr:T9SS type A sorting domain-containing protein [Candidatus Edwardsbacteria bacterium]MBU2594997.1 T9SS type A sorting domain-containing protein [Candidatus Edwardsbacteria bacterium]